MTTDPVADMLTRIRNAVTAGHNEVDIPASKMKCELARVLHEEGFIRAWKRVDDNKQGLLRVYLKHTDEGDSVIRGIRRISKPSRRVYRQFAELKPILQGIGVAIVSTSKGLLSDRQCRQQKLGGEVVCQVW